MSGLFQDDTPQVEDPPAPQGAGLFGDQQPEPLHAAPYRVLARKYRPTSFNDLIGQEAMVRILRNAFATGRVAHAFMLTGVRGVGKTTTARIIARALNCTGPAGSGRAGAGARHAVPGTGAEIPPHHLRRPDRAGGDGAHPAQRLRHQPRRPRLHAHRRPWRRQN